MSSVAERRSATDHPGLLLRTTKRGERIYVAIWRDEHGKQRERACRDEQTGTPLNLPRSKRFRERLLLEAEERAPNVDRVRVPRLSTYFAGWRSSYLGRTKTGARSDTRYDYACYIERHAMPLFGHLRVTEIEPRHLLELAEAIRTYVDDEHAQLEGRTRSAKTVQNRCAAFKVLVACAAEKAGIVNPLLGTRIARPVPSVPLERIADLKKSGLVKGKNGVGAITPKQLAEFFVHVPPTYRLLVWLIATTGMRVSEAVGLVRADVDLEAGIIRVERGYRKVRDENGRHGRFGPTKTVHGQRSLPITPGVTAELAKVLAAMPLDDVAVVFERNGEPIDRDHLNKVVIKKAMRSIGVPWDSTKTLRHTFATVLHGRVEEKILQLFMGHHDAAYTRRAYQHLQVLDQHMTLEAAFAQMGAAFDAPYVEPASKARTARRKWTLQATRAVVLSLPIAERRRLSSNGYKRLHARHPNCLPT